MFTNAITTESIGNGVTARCSIICNEAAVYLTLGPLSGFADPEAARRLAAALVAAADKAERHNEQASKRGVA